jgi:hypothetical protein
MMIECLGSTPLADLRIKNGNPQESNLAPPGSLPFSGLRIEREINTRITMGERGQMVAAWEWLRFHMSGNRSNLLRLILFAQA